MCLAVPAKVIEIKGTMARVDVEGNVREIGTRLVPDVKVGDWVLVHAGFAVEIVDEKAAQETMEIFRDVLRLTGEEDNEAV